MASKTINTILNLQDKMSPKLLKVSNRVDGLDKDTQRATRRMANMANRFASSVNSMVTKSSKFAAIGATITGAFALKTGLSEAFDLEGYRTQLETATKDTQKAGEIMKYSIELANRTPFEGGALVEGASKLEAMGMSAKAWLPKIGDMAAATNKDFDQAVEAIIDAQAGELERLKEFGITKTKIADKANKMFAGQEVVNAKGQIVNQEKFNEAMVAIMEERFTGGMEKQATTVKGIWSTITGVTKSSLATMVGMQTNGTIKSGSLLDKLKEKAQMFADKLQQWQSDGTLEEISSTFSRVFGFIYKVIAKVYNFIKKYNELIMVVVTFAASFLVLTKALAALKIVLAGVNLVTMILNGTLAICPITWIIAGIAAVIAIGVLLWKNWGVVKEKALALWEGIKAAFAPIGEFFSGIWGGVKTGFKAFINFIINGINDFTATLSWIPEKLSTVPGFGWAKNFVIPKIPNFALGTSYFKGGIARINERGGEIVNLPNGSKVIPADKSKNIMNKRSVSFGDIKIYVTGSTADDVINEVVPKLKLMLANI